MKKEKKKKHYAVLTIIGGVEVKVCIDFDFNSNRIIFVD